MKKVLLILLFIMDVFPAIADETDDLIYNAETLFETARTVCGGISDEIGKIANISKANTAVTTVGTVAAGGALVAGIKKSSEEQEIENLISKMCTNGACDANGVNAMGEEQLLMTVLQPMTQIVQLKEKIDKSKKLGNWRTGLLTGTIGTNVASAILAGKNKKQSELIQHITACNEIVKSIPDMENKLKMAGIGSMHSRVVEQLNNVKTWCNQINIQDIEKIEKRMKIVMGTSIAGGVFGIVGASTSATANSDKYMDTTEKVGLSEDDKKKEHALNTTANVMAGANIATGVVETGGNISLISLTKKLMSQAERCEVVLK